MARGKTINSQRRIIRITDWAIGYTASQLEQSLENIDQEANINAIISLTNRRGDVKKQFLTAINGIRKAPDQDGIYFSHLLLKDLIAQCYPEVRMKDGKHQDYEPYTQMTTLNELITRYKLISVNAYDKPRLIAEIIKLRTYAILTLPEGDVHRKATDKLREYSKTTF